MPHLTIEYSANLEGRLDLDGLLDALYRAALETGVFPLGGIRVRAHRADHYRIADCDPANAFVHVAALIGHGRPLDVRRRAGEHLFAALTDCLEPLYAEGPLAISFHVEESHPDLNFKRNNLHRYVADRKERAQGGASSE